MRPDDRELREAIKAVASQRRRFGYRRIHVMLQRQGIEMNIKKLRRLYGAHSTASGHPFHEHPAGRSMNIQPPS